MGEILGGENHGLMVLDFAPTQQDERFRIIAREEDLDAICEKNEILESPVSLPPSWEKRTGGIGATGARRRERAMTGMQYIFRITRFYCGCVYRTMSDDAVFCPEHRHSIASVGFITGQETIQIPGREVPQILGMVMNPYAKGLPKTMMNTSLQLPAYPHVLAGRQWRTSGVTPRRKRSVSAAPASSTW